MNTNRRIYQLLLILGIIGVMISCNARKGRTVTSGNPIFEGWYADPEAIIFDNEYWVYPTLSDIYFPENPDSVASYPAGHTKSINPVYNIQTYMDAFSSKDLIHWTKHPKVISTETVKWVQYALWAPSIIKANEKYYLFFGGNDIQSDNEYGGIGVAVADNPAGPFKDALGKPLIDKFQNNAQPIDQFVFKDDDMQYYLYYGGWSHCNVCKLSDDLLSLVPFEEGGYFKEITPENYKEGPFMFKRNKKYYFMWSEGNWQQANYSVAYAIAESPFGPFKRIGKILQEDKKVGTGAGHHSVIQIPGSDEWYIFYHRHPLGDTNGNHREVCIDRMYFNEDGTIIPVKMTNEGVLAKVISVAHK